MEPDPKGWRKAMKLTQVAAAKRLSITQAYLSQIETGARELTPELRRRMVALYSLPASELPTGATDRQDVTEDQLVRELAGLGYPGFSNRRAHALAANPSEVLLSAVTKRDVGTRVMEAMPWVAGTYPDLDWKRLVNEAKLRNAQNRLGYIVTLAHHKLQDSNVKDVLRPWLAELEEARLAKVTTLGRESMPEREQEWVRKHRPTLARYWNLLTTIKPDDLKYAPEPRRAPGAMAVIPKRHRQRSLTAG
jgi:transcriptional regulator with XRE-family HTH domain